MHFAHDAEIFVCHEKTFLLTDGAYHGILTMLIPKKSRLFYMNTTKRARFSLTISMIIFGTLAPFVRNITVSSGELALYRAAMAAILGDRYTARV